jgi:glycerol-3-phosphate acyltransferase PlsY
MADIWIALATALLSYLVGSISIARLVARLIAPDVNLENVHLTNAAGSQGQHLQTVGATTASVRLGSRVGCVIGILDILKGVLPVLVVKLLFPEQFFHLLAAFFVVIGHNWPIYYRFRGGGGMSPTYGGFFIVDFIGTMVSSVAGMIFGFFIIRDILIAYTSGLWFFLVWLIIFKGDWPHIVYGVVMNLIFTIALIPDVKDYIKKKRAGELDMGASMETFPMGRGMLKIMKFFKVEPRKKGG